MKISIDNVQLTSLLNLVKEQRTRLENLGLDRLYWENIYGALDNAEED